MIKIAVLEASHSIEILSRTFADISHLEFVGYHTSDLANVSFTDKKYQALFFQDFYQLLNVSDCVYINIPNYYDYAIAAIKNGKHLFLGQSIRYTIAELKILIKLAIEAKVVVQSEHKIRFNPLFLSVDKDIQQTLFLELHHTLSSSTTDSDLFNTVVSDIDIVLSKIDNPVKKIVAQGFSVFDDSIDMLNARIEFSNRSVAHIVFRKTKGDLYHHYHFFQKDNDIFVDLGNKKSHINLYSENKKEENKISQNQSYTIKNELILFLDSIQMQKLIPVPIEEMLHSLSITQEIFDLIKNKY